MPNFKYEVQKKFRKRRVDYPDGKRVWITSQAWNRISKWDEEALMNALHDCMVMGESRLCRVFILDNFITIQLQNLEKL